jgi:hypothetical protein
MTGALALLALAPVPVRAAKTDLVVMQNGDRVTCEVQELYRGRLRVKTDDMGTLDVTWNRVRELTANRLFEVEDNRGRLFYGSLRPAPEAGKMEVVGLAGTTALEMLFVVRIQPIKSGFWRRLDGSIDIGAAYTSSSRLTELSVDAAITFRRPTFQAKLTADSLVKRQPDVADTSRSSMTLGYTRFRGNRQVFIGQLRVEQNRELGFDIRGGVLGGWGRYLARSQKNEILGLVGLNVNREVPVDGEQRDNLEMAFALNWASFAYHYPKTDVEVGLIGFGSLSEWGRWRFDLDARVRRELFRDFDVSLKGYETFDSRPPTEGASRNDWGVSLGIGYTF